MSSKNKNKDKAEKPAKATGFENVEAAQTALTAAKTAKTTALDELKDYRKENELKKGEDYSQDKKHGPKIAKLEESLTKAKATVEEIEAWIKANKPKKERAARESMYEYPMVKVEGGKDREMDANEKKKHRAKMRAEKKKAAKGTTADEQNKAGKEEKADKKGKKSDKKADKKEKETATAGDD